MSSRLRCIVPIGLLIVGGLLFWPASPAQSPGAAAPTPEVTAIQHIRGLSPAQASLEAGVRLEGVLTFVDLPRYMCFMQDDTGGIYLQVPWDSDRLRPGDRLRVHGTVKHGRFTPYLNVTNLAVAGHGELPAARPVSAGEFRAGFFEGERVSLEGRVLATTPVDDRLRLKLGRDGDILVAWLPLSLQSQLPPLTDARIRVRGICAGVFNQHHEIIDFHLHVGEARDLEVLPAPVARARPGPPGDGEPQTIRKLERNWVSDEPSRVVCRGRITLHWPGRHLFAVDETQSLELRAEDAPELSHGDEIEATGIRTIDNRRMILAECSIRRLGTRTPVKPTPYRIPELRQRHAHGDYVEVEGDLAEFVRPGTGNRLVPDAVTRTDSGPGLVLRDGDAYVLAELPPDRAAAAFQPPRPRSRIRVAGVLAALPAHPGEPLSYRLLVPGTDSIRLVREASWWNVQRAAYVASGGGVVLVSGLGWWVGFSERRRRIAQQAAQRLQNQAARHRDALLELTRVVQTHREPDALPRITELVSRTLGEARVGVWRLDDKQPALHCLDLFDGRAHASGARLEGTHCTAYFEALDRERVVAAHDAQNDPRTRELAATYLVPLDIRSMLDVPLRFHGRAAGVLCIEHQGSPRRWDEDEQDFAAAVADQLTLLREANERIRAELALREAHSELEIRVMLRTTQLAEARDRAEAADRLKSAFLATMSHELRTPLNSIIGFTGILLQGLGGPLLPEQQKQLGMVQNSARHLLSLINDILDISKIEAGQVEIQTAPVALPEMMTRVTGLLGPLAQRKALSLTSHVDPAIGPLVTDGRRLEQILINLANNGLKFTERGGVRVEARLDPPHVVIAVTDTGIGIPADQIDRLFRPFHQLDSGLARHHEGTGLGLAISAGLARLLQGTLAVRSEPGVGSTFTLTLPREGPSPKR